MAAKLYLVDGSSILFRAFFAIAHLSTHDGRPTNAIFGTLKMAEKILKDYDPKYIAFVFDTSAPTFRHKAYAAYKANRPKMPSDMAVQVASAKDIISKMGVPILEMEGYEADDLIGTLASLAERADMETIIATADKDFFQLVRPGVKILYTKKENLLLDEEEVEKLFGVRPGQVVDVLGLWGDAVDNIPGVPGIGEKGAKGLIRQYGSMENAIAHAGEVSRKAYRKGLLEYADQARLSRELATIKRDVPLEWSPSGLLRGEPDRDRLQELYRKFEFFSLLDENGSDSFEVLTPEVKPMNAEAGAMLRKADSVGLAEKEGTFFLSDGRLAWQVDREALEPEFFGALNLCAYDLKGLLRRLGAERYFPGKGFLDAAVVGYMLDPSVKMPSADVLFQRFLNAKTMDDNGAATALGLARLGRPLAEELSRLGMDRLYFEIERPMVSALARMESAGVGVDVAYFEELGSSMAESLKALEFEIHAEADADFNVASPAQVGRVLFEKLGLPVKKRTAKTKSYSTDNSVLEALRDAHPVVPLLLEHRLLAKLKGTYVDAMPRWVNPETHRVHAIFNQTVTATGRLSSSDPNMQNIPARGEWGARIRRGFVAGEGKLFVGADYSQIELRVLAHLSGDKTLKRVFQEGFDIHTSTASEVFNVAPPFVTPEMRREAKAVNFGILYGMGAFGLARELGVSRKEAEAFIGRYFDRFPSVRSYLDGVVEAVLRKEEVTTLLGRRRLFPGIAEARAAKKQALIRQAINTTVQGSAADLIKKAMVEVEDRLPEGARLVLQVHDELIAEVPEDRAEETSRVLKETMESVLSLDVPLVARTKSGRRWSDLK